HLTELPKKLDVSGLARINAQSSYIQKALQSFRLVQQGISDSQVRVEQLQVNNIGSTQISLSNGWTVELGSIDTEARIRRLQELLNAIPNQEIAAIDLRYGKGAALTWRRDQEKG
ncbi:MAG: cell division protein FtsQ/DivIB, partial [Oleibacter sp.]|nr:cell division protein FtsQ/DivIB [Thalassolituus sp.]